VLSSSFCCYCGLLNTAFLRCGQFDTPEVSRVDYVLLSKWLTQYIDRFIITLLFSWKCHPRQAGFEQGAEYR